MWVEALGKIHREIEPTEIDKFYLTMLPVAVCKRNFHPFPVDVDVVVFLNVVLFSHAHDDVSWFIGSVAAETHVH